MDEDIDHAELYAEPARKRIKVNHLMNVFDQVRVEIGAKAILSKQLAKGALAWIPMKSWYIKYKMLKFTTLL